MVVATTFPAESNSVSVIVFPFAPTLSSPGSCIPLSFSSEKTVDPIDPNGTSPKSMVISPSSSEAVPLKPPSPGSFSGSKPGVKLITGEKIIPSVRPSPFVSACIPLSSESTPLSGALPVDDTGNEAGGINSII